MAKGKQQSLAESYIRKLKHGVKGDITVTSGTNAGRYPTHVEEVKDDMIGFAHPILQGAYLPVYKDLTFEFTMDDGAALYVYKMAVVKVSKATKPPIMWGEFIADPKRIQRRNYLRTSCLWDIQVFPLDIERKHPMSAKWLRARSLDVSIRGTRFVVIDELPHKMGFKTGDKLMIYIDVFDKEYYLIGGATRVAHKQQGLEVGVEFAAVPPSLEKRFFEYIRQQEIKGRQD